MQRGKKKKHRQTLICPAQRSRYPPWNPCPFKVTGETLWAGSVTACCCSCPRGLPRVPLLPARRWHATTAPDRNHEGTALPLPYSTTRSWGTAPVSCSQDRCRQQRFGTEEMSPWGSTNPLQEHVPGRGPCPGVIYGVWLTAPADEHVCQYGPDSSRPVLL